MCCKNEDGNRLPPCHRHVGRLRARVRRGPCRPGADHRLDGLDRQGRAGRHRTGRRSGQRFTVVIDPGHGGIDGGAEGLNGTIEKNVTLAFATELRDKLAAIGKYDVFMTRDTDEFLRLDDRVRIARQHEADLFISIHADTISVKGIRGATVYTVSDKASDAEAQALADRENLSDQLAGMEIKNENKEVTDILIDLIRRETHSFSMSFAHTLVGQLSTSVGLINNPHRSAGFKVLKAPDVPSVLVELGYLSNAKDEAQLLRRRMARQGGRTASPTPSRCSPRPRPERRWRLTCPRGACNQQAALRDAQHLVHLFPAFGHEMQALPYFAHMVATWVFDYGSGPAPKACAEGGFVQEIPEPRTGAGMIRLIGYFFGIGTMLALLVAAGVAIYIGHVAKDLPDYEVLAKYEPPVTTRIHASTAR